MIQYFYKGLLLAEREIIDAVSERALMDKTPTAARQLIANMAENTQQFHSRNSIKGVHETRAQLLENERIDNKLTKLTSLVRQLVLNQQVSAQQVSALHQPTRVCGICSSGEYHTNSCPQLQETSQSSFEMVIGVFQGQAGLYKSP